MNLKLALLISLLCLSIAAFAQQSSLKLYSNFQLLSSDKVPRQIDYVSAAINYSGLTIAFHKTTKRSIFHQLEAHVGFKNKNEATYEFKGNYFHLRYELGKYWAGGEDSKLDFYVGGAIRLFYLHEDIERGRFFNNPHTEEKYGVEVASVGGMIYNISDKLFFEVGAVLSVFSFSQENTIFDSPVLPPGRRNGRSFALDGFNDRRLRVGLGYRIGA